MRPARRSARILAGVARARRPVKQRSPLRGSRTRLQWRLLETEPGMGQLLRAGSRGMGLAECMLAIGRLDVMARTAFNEWGAGVSAGGGSQDASLTDSSCGVGSLWLLFVFSCAAIPLSGVLSGRVLRPKPALGIVQFPSNSLFEGYRAGCLSGRHHSLMV